MDLPTEHISSVIYQSPLLGCFQLSMLESMTNLVASGTLTVC